MKINTLIIIISLLSIIGKRSFAGPSVNTNIESRAKVDYFFEEKKHTKFNLLKFVFCWGGESNHDEKVLNGKKSSSGISGENKVSAQEFAGAYTGQSHKVGDFSWRTDFGEEDYIFNIQFKKKIDQLHRNIDSSTKCKTKITSYKIREFENKVTSNLELHVPENVWVIRFKATGFSDRQASFNLYGISEIDADAHKGKTLFKTEDMTNEKGEKIKGVKGRDGYSYYFIKPETRLKLIVKYIDNTLESKEFLGNIEVTYLGQNRCNEFNKDKVTMEYIKNSFNGVYQEANHASKLNMNKFHFLIRRIACISGNKNLINTANFNHSSDLLKILNFTQDFREDVKIKIIKGQIVEAEKSHRVKSAMNIFLNMFNYKLASATLKILAPLCKMVDFEGKSVLDLLNGNLQKLKEKLEIRNSLEYSKERKPHQFYLKSSERLKSGALKIYDFLGPFVNNADRNSVSINEISKVYNEESYVLLKKDILSDLKQGVIHLVEGTDDFVSRMPTIDGIIHLENFYNDYFAYQYEVLNIEEVASIMFEGLDSVDGYTLNIKDAQRFFSSFKDLSKLESNFLNSFYQLENYLAGEISLDLSDVHEEHFNLSRDWLETRYNGFLKGFMSYVDNSSIGVSKDFLNYTSEGCL